MCWERVFAITYFHDGPRGGVALLDGRPHVFRSVFDEVEDDYSDEFDLAPIDEALLPLIKEQKAIWERWAAMFHAGETSMDTNPDLSSEESRYNELKAILDPLLVVDTEKSIRRLAEFRYTGTDHNVPEVRWSLPEGKTSSPSD
ncbi:MAG: hypothetical protein GEU89_20975 [Kiloniellaceae bacterium]|nr:hypothetical protein [Kiloniellaceae bacterium]